MPAAPKRYEILERIGSGGMAEVFRARVLGETLTPIVVIKKILPHLSESEDFQTMFMDEARTAAALQHPNIVRLLDLGRMEDRLFMALELIEGTDLAHVVDGARARQRKVPLDAVLYVAIEVLKGLHHAHTRRGADGNPLGIVHRDVSPANVLVSNSGAVKLSDFGLARAKLNESKTAVGTIKGNAKFMAPEQIYGTQMDARTDVYATGMLLLTMLAGQHPFEGLPIADILDKVMKGEIPLPSAYNSDVPPALDQIVERATKISPRLRYASALELQLALESFAKEYKLHPRAKGLASLVEDTRREAGAVAISGSPSIVARLGPLIAESVAAGGGSIVATLGRIRMPDPTPAAPPRNSTGTLITNMAAEFAPRRPKAMAAGQGRLAGHKQAVSAVAIAPNGLFGFSASHDHTVLVWDLVNRKALRTLTGHKGPVTSIALAADGVHLITGSRDKTLRLWNAATGDALATLSGHTGWIFAVAISPDGTRALSGSFDHGIRLWDLVAKRESGVLAGHRDTVAAVAFSPDGKAALSGSYDKMLKTWDLASLREIRSLAGSVEGIRTAALAPDGITAIAAGADSIVRLWDLTWGTEVRAFEGHREPVVTLAFSPDGARFLSGGYDGLVKLWSVADGRCLQTFESSKDAVLGVAFGPDGTFAISGSGDGTVAIWDLSSAR